MDLEVGEQVELEIGRFTNVGITVLINDEHEGMLYKNEVYKKVREGQKLTGYVKMIREDGKIDVSLEAQGFLNKIGTNEAVILEKLKESEDGFLALNDKSNPEDIKYHLKMSKKSFKSAIGGLYKNKQIVIAAKGIFLVKE
jgi:predicted RNA-binding protein (virulence factor B family)